MGYRIQSLEVESFLGINQPITLDFDGKTTLITGKNGVGKTSIMRAIEYALFGNVYEMRGSQYSRNRNELNNSFATEKEARVKLALSDGLNDTIIERSKEYDSLNSHIPNLVIKGEAIHSEKEKALEEWRKMDENEFYLQGYLTQENFAQILEYTPKNRSEAFNRLLNTESLKLINEEYTSTIRHFKKKLELVTKASNRNEIELLSKKIATKKYEIHQLQKKFSSQYPTFELANLLLVFKKVQSIITDLDDVNNFDDLRDQIDSNIKQFQSSRKSPVSTKERIQDYFVWKTKAKETEGSIKLLEKSYNKLQTTIDEEGPVKELKREKTRKEQKQAEIKAKLKEMDQLTIFLKIAIEDILENHMIQCPICKNDDFDVVDVKNELTNRIRELKTDDLDNLEDQQSKLLKTIQHLDDTIISMQELKQQIENTYNDYLTVSEDLQSKLPSAEPWNQFKSFPELKFSNFEENSREILQLLSDLESAVDAKISEAERVRDKSDGVDKLTQLIQFRDICDANLSIQQKQEVLSKLEDSYLGLQRDDEQVERKIVVIEEIIKGLQEAQELIIKTQQTYIQEELSKLNPTIRKIYSLMGPHPHWSNMKIDLETKPRAGTLSTYFDLTTQGKDVESPVNVKAYFSKGQANRSILSLLLAIGTETADVLEFQLMDDITQSLDGSITQNFARTCVELSDKVQLIISTADERLVDNFRSAFVDNFKSYNLFHLGEWTTDGTQIENVSSN